MKDRTIGLIVIGSWIGIIEVVALLQGINGKFMISTVGALVCMFEYFLRRKEL